MLTWFSLSNVRSGCLLHPHMDVFMEYLESEDGLRLGVDETITSIYFNNRILCTQSQDKLQRAMLSLICKNQRYPYLKILCTVMSTNGVPVKRNQTDILTLLDVQRDKTFSMFEGAEGLARLKNLMLSGEHLGTVQGQMLKSEDLIRGRSPREMPKLEEKKDESSMLNKVVFAVYSWVLKGLWVLTWRVAAATTSGARIGGQLIHQLRFQASVLPPHHQAAVCEHAGDERHHGAHRHATPPDGAVRRIGHGCVVYSGSEDRGLEFHPGVLLDPGGNGPGGSCAVTVAIFHVEVLRLLHHRLAASHRPDVERNVLPAERT